MSLPKNFVFSQLLPCMPSAQFHPKSHEAQSGTGYIQKLSAIIFELVMAVIIVMRVSASYSGRS